MSSIVRHLYQAELGVSSAVGENLEQYGSWGSEAAPPHTEIDPLDFLRRADRVAEAFQAIDWSFSDADTGFLTHALHPYPAKFIPQIPDHCIRLLSAPGELGSLIPSVAAGLPHLKRSV